MIGGFLGSTLFSSIDVSSSNTIVVGGRSNDLTIVPDPNNHPIMGIFLGSPIVAYYNQNGYYQWGVEIQASDYYDAGVVKFNAAGSKILVVFSVNGFAQGSQKIAFSVLQASDGSLLYSKEDTSGNSATFSSKWSTLFDSSDNIYIAGSESKWGNLELVKLASPYSSFEWTLSAQYYHGVANSLTFGLSENFIYLVGQSQNSGSFRNYFKTDSSGVLQFQFSINDGVQQVPFKVIFDTNSIYECTHQGSSRNLIIRKFIVNNIASITFDSFSFSQPTTTGNNAQCLGINLKSTGTILQIVHMNYQVFGNSEQFYSELDYSTGTLSPIYRINLFSGSTNYVNDVHFNGNDFYYVGQAKTINDNLGIFPALTQNAGFIMYTSLSNFNQFTCLDQQMTLLTAITTTALFNQAQATDTLINYFSRTSANFQDISGAQVKKLIAPQQISNQFCSSPLLTIVDNAVPLNSLTYVIGTPPLVYSPAPMTLTGSCSSTTSITYTIACATSQITPDIITVDPSTYVFTVSTTDCSKQGTYQILVWGSTYYGQSLHTSLYLNVEYDCPYLTIQSTANILSGSYVIDTAQVSINFPFSVPAFCGGSCAIQMTCKMSGGSPLKSFFSHDNTIISVWTNSLANIGLYNIICTGQVEGLYSTAQVRIKFDIQGCGSSTITNHAPSNENYHILENTKTVTFTAWTSSSNVCNTQFTYTAKLTSGKPLPYFIQFDPTNRQFKIYSTSLSDVGVYDIEIFGTLDTVTESRAFTLTVLNPCPAMTVTYTQIPYQYYSLYTTDFTIPFVAFSSHLNSPVSNSASTTMCGTFTYQIITQGSTTMAQLTFLKLNTKSLQLEIYSATPSQIGTYQICLEGYQGTYTSQAQQNCFNLEIGDWCSSPTINPLTMTQSYNIGSTALTFTFNDFTPAHSTCSFTYTATFSGGTPIDSSFIALDSPNRQFTIYTTDNSKAGTSVIEVVGSMGKFIQNIGTLTITLTLTANPCVVSSQSDNNKPTIKTYILGTLQQEVLFKPFIYYPASCNYNFTYTSTQSDGSPLPSFIAFNTNKTYLYYQIETNSLTNIGSYIFSIVGQLNDGIQTPITFSWNLNIYGQPYFTADLVDQTVQAGQSLTYQLPTTDDPQSSFPIIMTVTLGSTSTFVQQSGSIFIITPSVSSQTQQYTIKISLKNYLGIKSADYTFKINVQALPPVEQPIENVTSSNGFEQKFEANNQQTNKNQFNITTSKTNSTYTPEPLIANIYSIDKGGLMTVTFNQNVTIPQNWFSINSSALLIEIIPGAESDIKQLDFNWKITDFTQDQFTIQLNFSTPEYVSYNLDMTGSLSSTMNSVMYGNLAMNIVLSGSLQFLWGMINALQMIVHLPMFRISFPTNAQMFFKMLMTLLLYTTKYDSLGSITAMFCTLTSVLFPPFVFIFLIYNRTYLLNHTFEKKFGALYEGITVKNFLSLMFSFFFVLRRIFFTILAIYFADHPYAQVQLMILTTLFVMVYIGGNKPFDDPFMDKLEVFNEITILIICYHLFLFTEFQPDPTLSSGIGYSVIAFTGFNMAVHMTIILKNGVQQIKQIIRSMKKKIQNYIERKSMKTRVQKYVQDPAFNNSQDQINQEILDLNDEIVEGSQKFHKTGQPLNNEHNKQSQFHQNILNDFESTGVIKLEPTQQDYEERMKYLMGKNPFYMNMKYNALYQNDETFQVKELDEEDLDYQEAQRQQQQRQMNEEQQFQAEELREDNSDDIFTNINKLRMAMSPQKPLNPTNEMSFLKDIL